MFYAAKNEMLGDAKWDTSRIEKLIKSGCLNIHLYRITDRTVRLHWNTCNVAVHQSGNGSRNQ